MYTKEIVQKQSNTKVKVLGWGTPLVLALRPQHKSEQHAKGKRLQILSAMHALLGSDSPSRHTVELPTVDSLHCQSTLQLTNGVGGSHRLVPTHTQARTGRKDVVGVVEHQRLVLVLDLVGF